MLLTKLMAGATSLCEASYVHKRHVGHTHTHNPLSKDKQPGKNVSASASIRPHIDKATLAPTSQHVTQSEEEERQ